VDFAFSEEQEALRAAARQYLADRFPLDRVAGLADSKSGWDPDSWKELSGLGWLDAELGTLEHAVLAEEAGYALYPGPLWTTIALTRPAYAGQPPADRPATFAWLDDEVRGIGSARSSSCSVSRTGAGWVASGVKRGVPDATSAEEAVVLAQGPDGLALWRLDLSANRNVIRPMSTTDRTRRVAELRLDATPVAPLVPASDTPRTLTAIRRSALALLACEAVGVTQRALDLVSSYVTTRTQFDRPIGAYQGVSHRVANIYTALQLARSLAYRAAWCVAEGDESVDEACATATVSAGHAAVFACENAIQAMGGIGFTWDHPLHRFYKRAQWINGFEGFPSAHRAELAEMLLGRLAGGA
jgi:alkylation response protein AidB-like acyl-CoA dehydrogenase